MPSNKNSKPHFQSVEPVRQSSALIVFGSIMMLVQFVVVCALTLYNAVAVSELRTGVSALIEYVEAEKKYDDEHTTNFDRFLKAGKKLESNKSK